MTIHKQIYTELRSMRINSEQSVEIVAQRMGITVQRARRIELGSANTQPEEIVRWANICDSSASKLFKKIGY